ncbi:MAG: murein biosynthesis integral membrane protein MurJ [Betaproteobacteria bacterium]|nr:murein biosynthesis integral membrane protein MurJ [Betaproteobacteria bacterium]
MSLFKAASTISILTLASRITGLLRELLMASAFGASALTDAFNVAWRIPNLFRRWFGEGAFTQAFVPLLAATKAKEGDAATAVLVSRVATVLFWTLVLTCVLGVVGAPVLVYLMASGMRQSPAGYDAAVVMTRFVFPYIGFMSMVALAAGVLNTYKRFVVPAATPVLLNMAWIAAAVWGAPWFTRLGIEPIYAICAGVMLGGALQLGVQLIALSRLGMFPRVGMSLAGVRDAWSDPSTRSMIRLMGPAILGTSVAQVSVLINTQIASHLATGSVSWFTYADRFMEFPTAMLGVALGAVLMPQLAAAKAGGKSDEYSAMMDWGLRLVVLLGVPCAVALLTFAQRIVSTFFQGGAFTATDTQQAARALMGYGVGLVRLVAIKVLAPGYYASQDVKTPMRIAVAVLFITQFFNYWLVPVFQQAGLALAVGLGALVNALWLLIGLMRRGTYKPQPGWGMYLGQVLAGSALMAVLLMWASQAVNWTALVGQDLVRIGLFTLVVAGAAGLYFAALWAAGLKVKQLMRR